MIKRVLLCTSPLQVTNARSIMDYLPRDHHYEDYVFIIHPLLIDTSKEIIRDLSFKLGYKDVYDFSSIIKNYEHENKLILEKRKFDLLSIKKMIIKKQNNYRKYKKKIMQTVTTNLGDVDILFFRMRYSKLEDIFISAIGKVSQTYGIEDGIGDYYDKKYWKYKTLNIYEIKHSIKKYLFQYFSYFISSILTSNNKISRQMYLDSQYSFTQTFTNIFKEGNKYVGDHFVSNVQKLFQENSSHKNKKVIIFGSLILNDRFKLNIFREIEIYNNIIEKIKISHNVKSSEIWYKPHPRLDYDSWILKKLKLNCSFFDYGDQVLGEVELCNRYLTAVYSVGSTSLLYAKSLFNIDSYFIDIRNEKTHKSAYKKFHHILKPLNVNIITI